MTCRKPKHENYTATPEYNRRKPTTRKKKNRRFLAGGATTKKKPFVSANLELYVIPTTAVVTPGKVLLLPVVPALTCHRFTGVVNNCIANCFVSGRRHSTRREYTREERVQGFSR